MEFALSPGQHRVYLHICQCATRARNEGAGRVLIVGGETGSGRSYLLRFAAANVIRDAGPLRVALGSVVDGSFASAPARHPSAPTEAAATLLGESLTMGAELVNPAFALIDHLRVISRAAHTLFEEARAARENVEIHDVLPRLLRVAAEEEPARPLVCLVDDADWLSRELWLDLQFHFAEEIRHRLPLVLVLCVEGPADLPAQPRDEDSVALATATGLVRRGVAEWHALAPISRRDVDAILGPSDEALVTTALAITRGRLGDLLDLWEGWRRRGAIHRAPDGIWRPVGGHDATLPEAADVLARRLRQHLERADSGAMGTLKTILGCCALEGRSFTAEAVAQALKLNAAELIDVLDTLVADANIDDEISDVILVELGAVEIDDLRGGKSRHVWRYSFSQTLDWRVLRQLADRAPGAETLARRLAEALESLYEPETRCVAHTLAALWYKAGDHAAARYYRTFAATDVSRIAVRNHAQRILSASTDDWSAADYADATDVLLTACHKLFPTDNMTTVLPYAQTAQEFAVRARPFAPGSEALALLYQGLLLTRLGDKADAKRTLERGRDLSRQGAPIVYVDTLRALGDRDLEDRRNDESVERARALLNEALRISVEIGYSEGEGACRFDLAYLEEQAGNLTAAREHNSASLAEAEHRGSDEHVASLMYQRGLIEVKDGDFAAAREYTTMALARKHESGYIGDEAECLSLLGKIEHSENNFVRAREHISAAAKLQRRFGDRGREAHSLAQLGRIERDAGRVSEARKHLERALQIRNELGESRKVRELQDLLDELRQSAS